LEILNDNRIYPLATLITGLPGETEDDVIATLELLDRLKNIRIFYVPLLFTSEMDCILNRERHADLRNLTELHWEVFSTCWRQNIKVWALEDLQSKIFIGGLLTYALYYRWLHGPKVLRPILKISGKY
ncbi:MAG: hypothetical protein QXR97_06860, partial [Thermoproteota archaeon]